MNALDKLMELSVCDYSVDSRESFIKLLLYSKVVECLASRILSPKEDSPFYCFMENNILQFDDSNSSAEEFYCTYWNNFVSFFDNNIFDTVLSSFTRFGEKTTFYIGIDDTEMSKNLADNFDMYVKEHKKELLKEILGDNSDEICRAFPKIENSIIDVFRYDSDGDYSELYLHYVKSNAIAYFSRLTPLTREEQLLVKAAKIIIEEMPGEVVNDYYHACFFSGTEDYSATGDYGNYCSYPYVLKENVVGAILLLSMLAPKYFMEHENKKEGVCLTFVH